MSKKLQFLYGSGLADKTNVAVTPGTVYLDLLTKELYFDDPSEAVASHQKIIDADALIYETANIFPTTNVISGLAKTHGGKTFAPKTLIGNIYNADGSLFDAVTKKYVDDEISDIDTVLTTVNSDLTTLKGRFDNLNDSGTLGSSKKPIYISGGKFVALSSTVGSNTKFMYMKSGTMTASSASVGGEDQLMYLSSGTFTASVANIGASNAPVYVKEGILKEISALDTAHGGTGATAHTANRLVWSENATSLKAGYHYAATDKIAVNYTSAPSYNFYVNGTSGFGGNVTVAGNITVNNGDITVYRETTKAADSSAKIAFSIKETETPVTTNSAYIAVYDDHDGQNYGTNMVITSPSALVIGAGESASNMYANVIKATSAENMYITADSSIYFYTKCNSIGDRLGVVLNTSRALYPELASAGSAGGTLGTTDYNWNITHTRTVESNDNLVLKSKSGKTTTINSGSTVYVSSGSGSSIIFQPQGTEQGRFNAEGYLLIRSKGTADAKIVGPNTAGTFNFPELGGTFVTHATKGTAVGSAYIPVYISNKGQATALSYVGVGAGGTGVTSHTANRLVWSTSASAIQGGYHYANTTKVAINSTSEPTENFYVNGTAKVSGNTAIGGTVTIGNGCTLTYDSTQKSLKFIFI